MRPSVKPGFKTSPRAPGREDFACLDARFDTFPPADGPYPAKFAGLRPGNRVMDPGSRVSPFVGLISASRNRLAEDRNRFKPASFAQRAARSSISEFSRLISGLVRRILEAGSRVTVGKYDPSAAGNDHLPFVGLIVNVAMRFTQPARFVIVACGASGSAAFGFRARRTGPTGFPQPSLLPLAAAPLLDSG